MNLQREWLGMMNLLAFGQFQKFPGHLARLFAEGDICPFLNAP
jgi:hypothetical protein